MTSLTHRVRDTLDYYIVDFAYLYIIEIEEGNLTLFFFFSFCRNEMFLNYFHSIQYFVL